MAVQVFRSTDSGAPAYGAGAGSIIAILDYCLVTKLGWSKVTFATNQVAYTQPAGSNGFSLQVDDTNASYARYVGWESLTAFNTGVNKFPSATQFTTAAPNGLGGDANGFYAGHNLGGNGSWRMYTNGNLFHLALINWNSSGGYNDIVTFGDVASYRAGDAFATICAGKVLTAQQLMTWTAIHTGNSSSGGIGSIYVGNGTGQGNICGVAAARRYTQIGGSVLLGALYDAIRFGINNAGGSSGSSSGNTKTYPEPISGAFELSPIWLSEPTTIGVNSTAGIRAILPGVWVSPYAFLPDLLTFTAAAGALNGRTFEVCGPQTTVNTGQLIMETSNTWATAMSVV